MATKFLSPEAQFRAGVNLREESAEDKPSAVAGQVAESLQASRGATPAAAGPPKVPSRTSEFAPIQNQDMQR